MGSRLFPLLLVVTLTCQFACGFLHARDLRDRAALAASLHDKLTTRGSLTRTQKNEILEFATAYAAFLEPTINSGRYYFSSECEELLDENGNRLVLCSLEWRRSSSALVAWIDYDIVVQCDGDGKPVSVVSIDEKPVDYPVRTNVVMPRDQQQACVDFVVAYAECLEPTIQSGNFRFVSGAAYDLASADPRRAKVTVEWYRSSKALMAWIDYDMVIELDEQGRPRRVLSIGDDEVAYPPREELRLAPEVKQRVMDAARAYALSQEPDISSGNYRFMGGATYDLTQDDPSVVRVKVEWYRSSKALIPWIDYDIYMHISPDGIPQNIFKVDDAAVDVPLSSAK